jgi:hypothetical protein
MALSSKHSVIIQRMIDILAADSNITDVFAERDIFYGDQSRIPNVPAITLDPGPRVREYNQTGIQTNVNVLVHVMVYHGTIDLLDVISKDADVNAEIVETALHADPKLIGSESALVIHSLVTSVEPGFVERGRSTFIASRLVWEGLVKEQIGV